MVDLVKGKGIGVGGLAITNALVTSEADRVIAATPPPVNKYFKPSSLPILSKIAVSFVNRTTVLNVINECFLTSLTYVVPSSSSYTSIFYIIVTIDGVEYPWFTTPSSQSAPQAGTVIGNRLADSQTNAYNKGLVSVQQGVPIYCKTGFKIEAYRLSATTQWLTTETAYVIGAMVGM